MIQWHIHTGWWSLVNLCCEVLMRHYIRGSWILMRTDVGLEEWLRPWWWSVYLYDTLTSCRTPDLFLEIAELPATGRQGTALMNTSDSMVTGVQIWIWANYLNLNLTLTVLFTKPPDGLLPYRMGSGGRSVWWFLIDIFPFCREQPVTKEPAALWIGL